MFLFLVNKISSSLPLPLLLQRLCPQPPDSAPGALNSASVSKVVICKFHGWDKCLQCWSLSEAASNRFWGVAGCQRSRELSPTCLLKHLAQNLETNKLESTAIKLRGDRKGSVLAWEPLQLGGEVVSNSKRATFPVFPGEKELNCPPSYKYWTVLGRKFGETLG